MTWHYKVQRASFVNNYYILRGSQRGVHDFFAFISGQLIQGLNHCISQ